MSVTLTEKAASEVLKIMNEGNYAEGTMLRIGVAGGGCSGLQQTLAFDTKMDEANDTVFDCHGVRVVVDMKSDIYLDGTTIDFYDGLEKRGFVFNNPNASRTCGCGSSFSV